MKALVIGILFFVTAFSMVSCGSSTAKVETKEEKQTTNNEAKESPSENPDYVELTDEQMKAIGIETGVIEQRPINSSFKVNGVLEVPNQYKAQITSLFAGKISAINVRPGSVVRKGQTVATIVNPDLVNMQQQYMSVNTRISLAELEYERQKTLVAGNAGARKNLQQAESELRMLRTERTALQKQLSTMGISPSRVAAGNITSSLAVPAPISGTVSRVEAQIGTYVDASTDIAEIINNAQMQAKLLVYEKDLPKVKLGQTIRLTTTNNPGQEYEAVVNTIGSAFESGTTTIPVRAAIKGSKPGLIDSMSIAAMISMGSVTVPSVPNDAIVSFQGQDYIFVQMDEKNEGNSKENKEVKKSEANEKLEQKEKSSEGKDESKEEGIKFKRVKVAKGGTSMGFTEIRLLVEIPANAKIIAKGAFFALGKMTNAGEEGE